MTSFHYWYLVALAFVVIEFVMGMCSLRRKQNGICELTESIYVMQHAKKPRRYDGLSFGVACVSALVLGILIVVSFHTDLKDEADRIASSFTTIEQEFHQRASAAVFDLLFITFSAIVLGVVFYAGRSFRRRQLDREVSAYNEGVEYSTSCSSVRYIEGTPSETVFCRPQNNDFEDCDPDEVMMVIRNAHNRLKESDRRRKIAEDFQRNPVRDRFYKVMGIKDR